MALNNDDYYYNSIFLESLATIEEYDPDNLFALVYSDKDMNQLDKYEFDFVKTEMKLERIFENGGDNERPFRVIRRTSNHKTKMFWMDSDVIPFIALCKWEDENEKCTRNGVRDRLYAELLEKLNPAYVISTYSSENEYGMELFNVANFHILYVDNNDKLQYVHIHDYTGFDINRMFNTLEPDFDTFVLPIGYHSDWDNSIIDDFFNAVQDYTQRCSNSLWDYIDNKFNTENMSSDDIDYIEEQITFMIDSKNIKDITKESLDVTIQSYIDEYNEKGHIIPEGYMSGPEMVDVLFEEEEEEDND